MKKVQCFSYLHSVSNTFLVSGSALDQKTVLDWKSAGMKSIETNYYTKNTINTISVHFILVPVASIIATIFPSVGTLTMNIILKKFTIKLISVVPLEKAFAVL